VEEYPELYSVLGARYGGDGLISFAIPDLRSEVAIGSGTGPGLPPRALGDYVGVESAALVSAQLPGHTHGLFSGATGSTGSGQSFENHQPSLTLRWAIVMNGIYPDPDTPNDSDQPVLGEIRPFAGDGPLPSGWAEAQGQILSIASNTGLFSVLGATYGGNGINTFALPDLRDRTPICSGQGVGLTNRVRGQLIGTPATTLTTAQLAPHAHVVDPNNTRRPGEPPQLRVSKNALDPSKIDLSWGVGCPSGATGFAVYQGTLGNFTSHALLGGTCGITGASLQAQTPCAGNCYYLVSAVDDLVGDEGASVRPRPGWRSPVPRWPVGPRWTSRAAS
jgi:microcystin-dependent protein